MYFLYFKVDHEKVAALLLVAAIPFVVTVVLRIAHAYEAVLVASVVVPLLELGLYVMWPRIEWARQRSTAASRSVPSAVSAEASSE